jgi:hypothetical protein
MPSVDQLELHGSSTLLMLRSVEIDLHRRELRGMEGAGSIDKPVSCPNDSLYLTCPQSVFRLDITKLAQEARRRHYRYRHKLLKLIRI